MAEKYIMVSIEDEKAEKLAGVLSNKTAKKILSYLADKEASEGDIARDLKLPANTVNYNVKNLIDSGLIEKSKPFFWSVKGKKINVYRLSKKMILISPRSSGFRKILTTFVLTGAVALFIKVFIDNSVKNGFEAFKQEAGKSSAIAAESAVQNAVNTATALQISNVWIWFLLGGICALLIYLLLNWRKL